MAIDRSNPSLYPPNIQAILKRPAPAAVILGQELLEVDIATGSVKVAYMVSDALANRFGALHGGMTAAILTMTQSWHFRPAKPVWCSWPGTFSAATSTERAPSAVQRMTVWVEARLRNSWAMAEAGIRA